MVDIYEILYIASQDKPREAYLEQWENKDKQSIKDKSSTDIVDFFLEFKERGLSENIKQEISQITYYLSKFNFLLGNQCFFFNFSNLIQPSWMIFISLKVEI